MAINPNTPGIHHIGLRCTDMERTKNFYQNTIGFPLVVDTPGLVIFAAGSVFVAFKKADPKQREGAVFSPFEIGLDHVAMTCETEEELRQTMRDLRQVKVDIFTLGQYLRPTQHHLPVDRYVPPADFDKYRQWGMEEGFLEVFSGPMVRSSYRAEKVFMNGTANRS